MRALLLVSTLSLPLPGPTAQEPEPRPTEAGAAAEVALPRPLLRVACDGPAAFRQAFLATNVGGLLGADESEPFIRPVQELLLQAFGDQRATLWPPLREYRGRMELLVYMRPSDKSRDLLTCAIMRMTGDGETDLDGIGKGLTALLRHLDGEEVEIEVGDSTRAGLRHGTENLVFPYRVGDDLWFAYATDPQSQFTEVIAAASQRPLKRTPQDAPLELELDLQLTAETAMHADGADEDDWRIAEAVWGISTMRSLQARVRAAGPQVMFELVGRFDPAPKGIFRGFIPQVQGEPTLTHLVPPDCPAWKDGRLRLDHLVDDCIAALTEIFESGDRKKVDAEMKRELGFDLIGDLLVHLGDEVLIVGGPWTKEEGDQRRHSYNPLDGSCFVFEIAKPDAFVPAWEKARAVLFSEFSITSEPFEVDGVEVHGGESPLMDSSIYTAVTDDLGLMAFGDQGLALLEKVLARRDEQPGPPPHAVQRMLRQAPAGFNGAARADVHAMFGGQLGILKEVLEEVLRETGLPVEADVMIMGLEPYGQLLAKHQLDQVVTLTGYDAGTWTFRVLW